MMLFMTLPPYTRTSKGEVHELGLGVRNCSHRALSDPLSEKSESIERACEDTSAEGTARCASRGTYISYRTENCHHLVFSFVLLIVNLQLLISAEASKR